MNYNKIESADLLLEYFVDYSVLCQIGRTLPFWDNKLMRDAGIQQLTGLVILLFFSQPTDDILNTLQNSEEV